MTLEAALTLGVLALAFAALAAELWSPEAVLLAALAALTAVGILDIETAVRGFGNPVLVALACLYIVAAALKESGGLDAAGDFALGRKGGSVRRILLRMTPGVSFSSAFLNNTPVVAMGIPTVRRGARRLGIPASKLLIPLSYAAILGGLCTLIGTSSNLVIHGLLEDHGLPGFTFFELAWVGVPCALVGVAYLVLISPALTPERADIRAEEELDRTRLLKLELAPGSPLVGRTPEEAGLAVLPGLRLVRVNREGREIAPVPADEHLQPGDRLLYASPGGGIPGAPDLSGRPGVRVLDEPPREIPRGELERELHEVVVRGGSSLTGVTVEGARFPERFGAAVTGLRRHGRRLDAPFGDVSLRPGDVLLLDTRPGFREAFGDADDFFITSETPAAEEERLEGPEEARPAPREEGPRHRHPDRSPWVPAAVLAGIMLAVIATGMHIALAGLLGVTALFAFRAVDAGEARRAVDWSVLLVIGAALGLARAMEASGAAGLVASWIVEASAQFGPRGVLLGVVLATALLTELVTNNGAAAIMFPVALAVAEAQVFEPRALVVAVTLVASMSLLTPIGYQTNLMVYGPGNYRFTDFFRVGAPLQLLLWAVVVAVAPLVWPL